MARGRSSRRERQRASQPLAQVPIAEPASRLIAHPWALAVCALGVSVLALLLYLRTLAPTITLVDSGELALAARDLGVAHPPGTPLWVLLAHLFTRLPWGSVAQRVNASSAVFAALAAGGLTLAWRAARLTRSTSAPAPELAPGHWTDLVPALVTGLLLAVSHTLWSYATLTEVYALNTAFVVFLLGLVSAGRRPFTSWRPLLAAAFVLGLALGVHHATIVVSIPALLALAWPRRAELDRRRALTLVALAIAGAVLVYATLPLAALRQPLVAWGNPIDLQHFLTHVSARQYSAFLDVSAEGFGQQTAFAATWLGREFGTYGSALVVALATTGLLTLVHRDRPLFAAALLLSACDVALKLVYGVAEDQDAYLLPLAIGLAFMAGFGAEWLLRAGAQRGVAAHALVATVLLAVPALALMENRATCDRSRFFVADDFVADALQGVGQDGLLLTSEWQLFSPLLYYREVESRRPDVLPVDVSLLRRAWYFDTLRRQAPQLMQRADPVVAPFLEDLRAWERDPRLYARDAVLNRRIDERFHAMVLGLVDAHRGPVYATSDVVLPDFTPDPGLARSVIGRFGLAPRGLVFELTRDAGFHEPGEPSIKVRGLFDGTLRFEPDDVALTKLRPMYVNMVTNRGRYLEAFGQSARAERDYLQALAWDPNQLAAAQGLGRIRIAAPIPVAPTPGR